MHHDVPSTTAYERAIRLSEVANLIGLSRSHIYRLVERGLFPAPVRLSDRVTVWREADVQNWLAEKFAGAQRHRAGGRCD
jgi:prophage regulatory protein